MADEPVQRTGQCPTCGKLVPIDEHNSLRCPDCRNRSGTFAELWIDMKTGGPLSKEHTANESLSVLRNRLRERFGSRDVAALEKLRDWLVDTHGMTHEQVFVTKRTRLVELLKSRTPEPGEPEVAPAGDDDGLSKNVAHSSDFRSIRWGGETYSFTERQAPVVEKLYEAWTNGAPDVGRETLLQAVDHAAPPSRLDNLFRDSLAWKTLIVQGGTRGTYRLKEPDA